MTSPHRSRRAALWLATVALLLGLAVPVPALAADPEPVDLPSVVTLEGLLRVTPVEPEPQHGPDPADPMPTGSTITLHTPEGTSVELTGAAVADARSGERFRGTVRVDQAVATVIERDAAVQEAPPEGAELGELVADTSAALDRPLRVVTAATTMVVQPTAAAKAHTVDIMYVHAAGQSTPSTTLVTAMVSRLSEFWASESNGQISGISQPLVMKTAVVPESLLCDPLGDSGEGSEGLWEYAAGPKGFNRQPVRPGYPAESYYWAGSKAAHLIVISPAGRCREGIGVGTVSSNIHAGGVVWASVTSDPFSWDGVVFHEVGHNLGLDHSNVTVCDAPAVDGASSCEMEEYLDFYDVMGAGFSDGPYSNDKNIAALNVTHKVQLNSLPRGSALREVRRSGGTKQEFTLAPAGGRTGIRGLEITDPLNSDKLYVEYRSGTGRDAESFYTQYSAGTGNTTYAPGVRVLKLVPHTLTSGVSYYSSVLLHWEDTTPSLSHQAGDQFRSRSRDSSGKAGVRLAVVSTGPSGAKVRVHFDALKKLTTKTPTISGTPRIGVKLTAKPGKWTSGTSFSYQWLVSGKAIKGATKSTFVPRKSDKGKQLTVKVTGTKTGYAKASATSKKSSKVRPLLSLKKATPKISGTAKVGGKLTAKPGTWTSGAKLSYQWLVAGKAVAGATARTFTPRAADKGRTITVKVTGKKAGYKTASKTSKATKKVKA